MKDLIELTGVPRTSIHFYLRSGLLPQPQKTARNAALYSDAHRARLDVIRDLRSGHSPVPLPLVRRALDLVDKGIPASVAIELMRSVYGDQPTITEDGEFDEEALAGRTQLPLHTVQALLQTGVIMRLPGSELADGLDLEMMKQLRDLLDLSELGPEGLARIAQKVREIVAEEMDLRDQLVENRTPAEAAALSATCQRFANGWHAYLFFRARLHEIAKRGLGVDEGPGGSRE